MKKEIDGLQEPFVIDKKAKEVLLAIDRGGYTIKGKEVRFPKECGEVEVIFPRKGEMLLQQDIKKYEGTEDFHIAVTNEDSFCAAEKLTNPLVMNFANAYIPGGGFLTGAIAQEEALCRASTLYQSITNKRAEEMYAYNVEHRCREASDYMLYSPCVSVFRSPNGQLLENPFTVSVVTVPAPNRSMDTELGPDKQVKEIMMRRIRIMLRTAMKHGNKDLVLGAWGCGVFRNDPKDVADSFRKILVDEGYGKYFNRVSFAIYGDKKSPNFLAFRQVFAKELNKELEAQKSKALKQKYVQNVTSER